MADLFLLRSLGIMVIAAAVFVLVARLAHVPSIVAYILAGLALGPLTGFLQVAEATELIAEAGIVLLLFLVGLELRLDKIRDVGKVAIVGGVAQVLVTGAFGMLLSMSLGFAALESLVLATALTFSSTVVVVKLLTEKGELDSLHGRVAVGILLVQDVIVILILTFMGGLGGVTALDVADLSLGIGSAFAGMALLLLTALLAAQHVLPRLFGWISSSLEALYIWSLCWCFLLVVAAELLHLSVEVGAFVAGISLAQLPYNQELRRRVHPLMNFFIAIFFLTLGIQMELDTAIGQWFPALVVSLFVLLGKPMIFMWLIGRSGYGERTSFLASVSLAQVSEFSFIFASLGVATGLIGESVLSVIALVGLLTIAVSSYMLLYAAPLHDRLRGGRLLGFFGVREVAEAEPARTVLSDHIVVIGLNTLGAQIIEALLERGETVLAIDTDPSKLRKLKCATLLGSVDHPSVLEEANFRAAKLVVSALQIEDTNNLLAYRCHRAGVPSSIHAFDKSVVEELRAIGASHLMIPKNNGIKRIMGELKRRGVVTG